MAEAGKTTGLTGLDSSSTFLGSSSLGGGGGGGGGARLGHWPISAFSKETGCEKSDSLRDEMSVIYNDGYIFSRYRKEA